MENLIQKWFLVVAGILVAAVVVCEKPAATESAVKLPVLHAIPRVQEAETSELPTIEAESGEESVAHQSAADQDTIPAGNTEIIDEIFDDASQPYQAKSNLDPFMPLIQEKPALAAEARKPDKPLRILTPLEKMALSQVKLVAVVIGENRRIAMVEEATGKGYEVGIGTYMGQNAGQVVDIQSDRIVVREMVEDFRGGVTERLQELKLHKPDSGE